MPVGRQQEVAFTRAVLVGSLLISLVLGAIARARGELGVVALVVLAALTLGGWLLVPRLGRRDRPVTWLISLAILNLVLVVPELALRVGGFRHDSGVELRLTEEKAFSKLVRDPELFWKYDPERPEVNSWGFEGPEVAIPKPAGVYRVLFLGDSCADLGRPPYPEIVERVLDERVSIPGVERVESVSLSIVGYTSHQGLVVARRYGALVEPDVVVLHYGWNDHWLAYGGPDDEVSDTSTLATISDALYSSSRLLQFAHSVLGPRTSGSEEPEGGATEASTIEASPTKAGPADLRHLLGSELRSVTRVSPDRYRQNLLAIARVFEDIGVPVVFVTPPSSHRTLGTPQHFVDLHYAVDREAVVDLHEEYSAIVREVARDSGEHLFDLERLIDGLSAEQTRRIFLFDGIHYAPAGCRWVGRQVAEYLRSELDLGPAVADEPAADRSSGSP